MVLLRGFERPELYRGGIVSIGNFDGVHAGHREIVRRLAALASEKNVPAVILTFVPHPLQLLRPQHVPPSLTTLEQKAELLHQAGATCVIAYPTDRGLLELTPEQFFDRVVVSELKAKGILEGPNFCFGKDRKGNVATLRDLCRQRNVELEILEAVGGCDRMVSSSAIRSHLSAGRIEEAVTLLGHPYRLHGHVVEGARRGRTIGFPTANLSRIETLIPADGVYAGTAWAQGAMHRAAINVGPNPTFGEDAHKVEVHLLDFSGDLYGRSLEVDLFRRVRDTRRFSGPEELIRQLALDIEQVRMFRFDDGPLCA